MPHLSPLNWLSSPLTFWLLLMLTSSILWWSQSPSFPIINTLSNTLKPNMWNW